MGAKNRDVHTSRQLWLVPREGQAQRHLVAEVAVAAPAADTRAYAVPDELRGGVQPGATLHVPFGRGGRVVEALCLRVSEQPWDHTRAPILDADPGQPWLSRHLATLGLWVADYYVCSPWKTFAALLPAVARRPRLVRVAYVRATGAVPDGRLSPRQLLLLAAVGATEPRVDAALRAAGVGRGTLRALCVRGLMEVSVRREPAGPVSAPPPMGVSPCAEDDFDLTAGQRGAYTAVATALAEPECFRVFLLFGVPGSGKTEVYVRLMRQVIANQRQAILLIPEIALATQVVDRLVRRFARVAILHSRLTATARQRTLAAIASGAVDVVIGTRSAVFAPCPRLGLIVVDEEQETSFKNLAAPFYHARDVAIKRGQIEQIPVLLGSATPALETWYNAAHAPHFTLLHLPERVPGAEVPRVQPVEHGRLGAPETDELLSTPLRDQITRTLVEQQQVILLHNRRGYAPFLRCAACGLLLRCERCGSHLVFHQAEDALKCHRCGAREAVPQRCLDETCRGELRRSGSAIQRLEEELRAAFPAARLLRLDSDTMKRREDYRTALRSFEDGQADILLGTQMVAKGLDFPRVRLVGVVEADAALTLPDLRAAERVFQLIVQVVGRAGRREGQSLAVVQTAERPPAVVRHALRMDYASFAAEELEARARLEYPPAVRLVRLVCADARPHRARDEAIRLAEALTERAGRLHARVRVDHAEPCIIRQQRGLLRYQILVRGPRGVSLGALLREAARGQPLAPRVQRFTIDVDPIDLF